MVNNNIQAKIDAFNQCLKSWSKWNLTLIEKITVIKTFAVPRLIYPLSHRKPFRSNTKRGGNKYVQVFMELRLQRWWVKNDRHFKFKQSFKGKTYTKTRP